jgi:hypothetical protein
MSNVSYGIVFASLLLFFGFLFRRQLFPSISIKFDVQCGSDRKAHHRSVRQDLDRVYFRDYFHSFALDTIIDMAKARLAVSNSLLAFREQKKILEASMGDVEMFLRSNREFYTGSLVTSAQRDANLETNEANFVRSQYALHDAVSHVQAYLGDLREITYQLRAWMTCGVSPEVQAEARRLINEIEAECKSVRASLSAILREADSEPVGVGELCDSEGERISRDEQPIPRMVSDWRQERAEARSKIRPE